MGPGVFDYQFKMKGLFGIRAAPLLNVTMRKLCRSGAVGIAQRADLSRNGMGGAPQLVVYDLGPRGRDPVQSRIAGQILEGQERDAFYCRDAGTGTSCAAGGHEQHCETSLSHQVPLQRTLYSAARIS